MKAKILVVDDTPDVLFLIKKSLEKNYIIETATNADETMLKVNEFHPDLIILDIVLPEVSGFEICSLLKSKEDFRSTPIIFLSGKVGTNSRITGYKLGAVNYIEKPFEPEELREVVNATLVNIKEHENNDLLNFEEITLNIPSQEVIISGEKIHFTSSEFKIIHLLLKNNNRVLSREKILNYIAPGNLQANDRMIDTYISALRRKIKESSFAIKSVYGEGYKIISSQASIKFA
jgi:DNA-binding response OmpR family regulator